MTDDAAASEIKRLATEYAADMVRFLRDLIAIPSESGQERAVAERIAGEMVKVGFDEVKIDGLGNVLGRVGSGPRVIAIDGHVDTVGVGDPGAWWCDPYRGDIRDGVIYGRGASDQKAGIAAAVHGARILKTLGGADECQLWVTGTVMEEDCDGLCWQYILRNKVIEPHAVVITEPTNLQVYRGHRGRMELEVTTRGLSCHGSAPERGVNAIYKMAPIVKGVEALNEGRTPKTVSVSVTRDDGSQTGFEAVVRIGAAPGRPIAPKQPNVVVRIPAAAPPPTAKVMDQAWDGVTGKLLLIGRQGRGDLALQLAAHPLVGVDEQDPLHPGQ